MFIALACAFRDINFSISICKATGSMLRVKGQVLYLYCCDLAPTVESFAVWRPRIEVSDLQHDGNHGDKCKAIRICATESGKGDQERLSA